MGYPGFVDSHTHPAFAGNRAKEFSMRMEGATYQEIATAGGGILSTVRATRKATQAQLTELIVKRMKTALSFGVRLMEAKSGYGLTLKDETKSLVAILKAQKSVTQLNVISTCLAAHAVPPEFKGKRDLWVNTICEKILPAVKKNKLAPFVDVFCDEGYFTVTDTRKIFMCAKELGLQLRLHGDELANTGSAELGAEMGALSVDHLLKVSDKGIRALSNSDTIATLLPGTSLFLKEPAAPARKLIDAGVPVALASDFNPGSCTTQNLPFIANLAALHLGMSCAEIIAGLTWNGARALAQESNFGALLPGFRGEPVFCEGDHPAAVYYRLAPGGLVAPKPL